jgi:hypothetical protein
MTPSEKYVEGQWYGWNGGECPVHPETVVDTVTQSPSVGTDYIIEHKAGKLSWHTSKRNPTIIAFRVVKHHVEPKVVWVNEYSDSRVPVVIGQTAHKTKESAKAAAAPEAIRIAVRYVESPE